MLLAIDSGNTNIVCALFDQQELKATFRLSSQIFTADELALRLKSLLALKEYALEDITDIIIANVVPQQQFALETFCKQYCKCQPLIVGKNTKLPCKANIDNPDEVGADRLVNAVAAFKRYQSAAIIIDFGTATTFDVVDNNGNYSGGVIAPGIDLSLKALHAAAAKLPLIQIEKPSSAIGTNTAAAMQAGIFYGYKGLIKDIISNIKDKKAYGQAKVIATGGLASLFFNEMSEIDHHEPELTINGLQHIYTYNKR